MLDNLCYIHGVWLVIRPITLQTRKPLSVDEQPGSRVDGQQRRQTKEETGKGQIENDMQADIKLREKENYQLN